MNRNHLTTRLWRALPRALAVVAGLAWAAAAPAATVNLRLEPQGLEPLGRGYVYEGWVIADGAPVSTGTFTVSADGTPSQTDFTARVSDGAAVEAFVLTIEPSPDPDPAPSAVHVLGGNFAGGVAQATVGHAAALGSSFADASGSFFLAAPSAGDGGDYRNGIWWIDPDAGPGAGLSLPTLPDGWVFEGWVAGPGGVMSTGRFSTPDAADSDAGGLGAGPYGTPPFPGQDLVNPPVDLTGGFAAVISVEPEPDDSPAPFVLKPLVGMITDAGAMVSQSMNNQAGDFPSAIVQLLDAGQRVETAYLHLDLSGLEDTGSDWVYEGWLIVHGAPVSTGTFTVAGGLMAQRVFSAPVASLDAISTFVLTIEPVPDPDPAPSAIHLVGGDFVADRARLSIDHPAAIGTDFSGAAGSYILAAPSAGAGGNYRNGIWWLDMAAGPGPALDLPELPEGWVYEGWVAGDSGPVSTGRFTSVSGADGDGGGPDAGPEGTPPFPGQDFVNPPRDLTTGYAAVISVEPEPDTSATPFVLKPLPDPVVDDVGMGVLQPMARNLADLPAGFASLMAERLVSASGHTAGVASTSWRTDLELHNPTAQAAAYRVELLLSGQPNPTPMGVDFTLPAGASVRHEDAVDALFGVEATGALRVVVSDPGVQVGSRTFNQTVAGTFGQSIPSATSDDAVDFGEESRLIQLSAAADTSSGYRTNLVLLNPDGAAVEVRVDLYDATGRHLGTLPVTLGAFEQRQLNGVFAQVTTDAVDVGYAGVRTQTPGGRALAYASVVDNLTGDAIWVTP